MKTTVADAPILFATLDHTNEGTTRQAVLLAHALGLEEVYNKQEKASGFMLLIDAKSKEVLATITRDQSEQEISEAFQSALAPSSG